MHRMYEVTQIARITIFIPYPIYESHFQKDYVLPDSVFYPSMTHFREAIHDNDLMIGDSSAAEYFRELYHRSLSVSSSAEVILMPVLTPRRP